MVLLIALLIRLTQPSASIGFHLPENEEMAPISEKDVSTLGDSDIVDADRAVGTSQRSGKPAAAFCVDSSYRLEIDALAEDGFSDADTGEVGFLLEHVSRYHLAPYLRAAKAVAGTGSPTVQTAYHLLLFDQRCQSCVFEFIGVFEKQLRAQYAHWMKEEYGPLAIYNQDLFIDSEMYEESMERVSEEVERKAQNNAKFEEKLVNGKAPIDIAVECMTLGTLSQLYANTKRSETTDLIAASFGQPKKVLINWTKTINAARNCCAHFECYFLKRQIPSSPLKVMGSEMSRKSPMYLVLILEELLSTPMLFRDRTLHFSSRLGINIVREVEAVTAFVPELLPYLRLGQNWKEELLRPEILGAQVESFIMLDERGVKDAGFIVTPEGIGSYMQSESGAAPSS